MGEAAALRGLEAVLTARSAKLGAPDATAHMDPPTPPIVSALVGLLPAWGRDGVADAVERCINQASALER